MSSMSFPAAMRFVASKLDGFAQNNQRLSTTSLPNLMAGDQLQLMLADNVYLDTSSLVIRADVVGFRNTGANSQAILPLHSSSFIDAVTIDIGGQVVDGSISSQYGQLAKLKTDMYKGTSVSKRSVLELSTPDLVAADATGSALARVGYTNPTSTGQFGVQFGTNPVVVSEPGAAGRNAYPITIKLDHTFLGIDKVLDLSRLPQIRITARLASSSVVCCNGNAADTVATYGLYNIRAYANVISFQSDGPYSAMVHKAISEDMMKINWLRYYTFTGAPVTASTSVRFDVGSKSVNAIYGLLLDTTPSKNAPTTATGVVPYFGHRSTNVLTNQIDCAGFVFPQWQCGVADSWYLLERAFPSSIAVDASMSLTRFASEFYSFAWRFSFDDDVSHESGYNTRGQLTPFSWLLTTSGNTSCSPLVLVETTATLRLGPNRSFTVEA